MAIKKSELYSSLWASCDELRGGMDASQYKDYVLVMLFLKYISDKWAGKPFAPIKIPEGSSFEDMIKLKGKTDIGDQINKKIIGPIAKENRLANMPDFDDKTKLGDGKEMVERLTNLIAIFQRKELDFSKNRADGDDILGDAYEYLMRHFATESGKSKGQFYTPAEVSRIMAKIIGIGSTKTSAKTKVYDPTCGSGSLLLRVASEAKTPVSLYGQEKDATTAGLARMNLILHDYASGIIEQGNTLANPLFKEKETLMQFDFVVANPPFSDKRWGTGLQLPEDGEYNRFADYGVPPAKNGDFAYLLHIVRSLKRKGKGAVILPHGVLFRGNAEAEIRQQLIKKGYIKGIIGLPANLFYGTGIPAAIIVIDKEGAGNRKGIFMIDAGKGFIKDGNKNRLREQDIRRIADVFNGQQEFKGYSRMVKLKEINSNDYNLNIPRYIDGQEQEDIQDIAAHLLGGIPVADVEALSAYWEVFPNMKNALFAKTKRKGYLQLKVKAAEINQSIFEHPEFVAYRESMDGLFAKWKKKTSSLLRNLTLNHRPKELIVQMADDLLKQYTNKALVDKYNVYQHLLSYWNDTMQDDCYLIAADGWKAEAARIEVMNSKKKLVDKGWTCDLIPKKLIVDFYFKEELETIAQLQVSKENLSAQLTEMEEEHNTEEGYFAELNKVNKANVQSRLKALKGDHDAQEEIQVLNAYLNLVLEQSTLHKKIKIAEAALDDQAYHKYPELSENDIKSVVVDAKWMAALDQAIQSEIDQISQRLTSRIKELAERYERTLPEIDVEVKSLEKKVQGHLEKMGFVW